MSNQYQYCYPVIYNVSDRSHSRSIKTNNHRNNQHRVFTPSNPSMLKYFSKSASLAQLTSPTGFNTALIGYAGSTVQLDAQPSRSNSQVVPSASGFVSGVEQAILKAHIPIEISETDEITINGQRGIYANKQEVASWKGKCNDFLD